MKKFEKLLTLNNLLLSIVIVMVLGLLLSVFSVLCTMVEKDMHSNELCFSSDCISYFFDVTKGSFVFLEWAGKVVIGGGTLLAVIIGVLTYQSNELSSNVSNNIAQYNHFSEYIEKVLLKYKRISINSIDALKWYRLVYADPAVNDFTVSENYSLLMREVNDLVRESGELYVAGGGRYKYKNHQFKIIDMFKRVGISMESGPRVDFLEVEKEVIELINGVNGLFCSTESAVLKIMDPRYQ